MPSGRSVALGMNDEEYFALVRFIRGLHANVQFIHRKGQELGPPSDYTRGAVEMGTQTTTQLIMLLGVLSGRSTAEVAIDVANDDK